VLPSISVNRNVVTPDEAFTSVRLE